MLPILYLFAGAILFAIGFYLGSRTNSANTPQIPPQEPQTDLAMVMFKDGLSTITTLLKDSIKATSEAIVEPFRNTTVVPPMVNPGDNEDDSGVIDSQLHAFLHRDWTDSAIPSESRPDGEMTSGPVNGSRLEMFGIGQEIPGQIR